MTEEKQSKIDEIIEKKTPIWMTMVKAVVFSLLGVLILVSVLAGVLQFTTFNQFQAQQSPDQYLSSQKTSLTYGDQGFMVPVPEEVVGYELSSQMTQLLVNSQVQLENLYYDGEGTEVMMNLTYLGFYLPVGYQIDWSLEGDMIRGQLYDLTLSRHHWPVPNFLASGLEAMLKINRAKQPSIFPQNYGMPTEMSVKTLAQVKDKMVLTLSVEESEIAEVVNAIRDNVDPDLLAYYKTYDAARTALPVALIEQVTPVTHKQIIALINDAKGSKHILNDLLLLTEGYDSTQLKQLLEGYGLSIDEETINLERKAFKGQAIDPVIAEIFVGLDDYFAEKMLAFNQGKPFDFEAMNTLTIEELAKIYNIELTDDLLTKLSFIYDEEFKVAYWLDPTTYYLRSIDHYDVITNEDYATLRGASVFVKPYYVTDPELWAEVTTFIKTYFQVEDVFVRYMKTDGISTFTVISTDVNPQDYWAMALYKRDGVLELLDENVDSVANLIIAHPEFNVETATREIETIAFERNPDSTHEAIIDELYDIGAINSKKDTKIVYSSYDGKKYIAFKLNNGDEYVFKVELTTYGTYLQTVYNKDRAIKNWKDMSELLLLQDPPE